MSSRINASLKPLGLCCLEHQQKFSVWPALFLGSERLVVAVRLNPWEPPVERCIWYLVPNLGRIENKTFVLNPKSMWQTADNLKQKWRLWDFDPVSRPSAHCAHLFRGAEVCGSGRRWYKSEENPPCERQNCFLKKLNNKPLASVVLKEGGIFRTTQGALNPVIYHRTCGRGQEPWGSHPECSRCGVKASRHGHHKPNKPKCRYTWSSLYNKSQASFRHYFTYKCLEYISGKLVYFDIYQEMISSNSC